MSRDPKPFKNIRRQYEVDTDTLKSTIFGRTKVVVVVNPCGNRPSEGVLEEIQALRIALRQRHNARYRNVLCGVNIDYINHNLDINYDETVLLPQESEPSEGSIAILTVAIACQLLNRALEEYIDIHEHGEDKYLKCDLEADIPRLQNLLTRLHQKDLEGIMCINTLQHAILKAKMARNQSR